MTAPDSSLSNPDLAPTTEAQRTWRWWHYAALWVGMTMCIPAWMLASGLIDQGLSPAQAVMTVLAGNAIVLVPMVLIGHAGARYGVPYAVLVRASFGVQGAKLAALARAIVACGWYGIQTWVGGGVLLALVGVVLGAPVTGPPLPVLGISLPQLVAFLLFWGVQLFFVTKGMETVKRLETWTAPAKLLICVALVGWALSHTSLDAVFAAPATFGVGKAAASFHAAFWPGLTAMVGFWATLALNIPDFTRFARTQRDQMLGQAVGLPVPMGALAAVAVIATAATEVVYGKAILDPVELATRFPSVWVLVGLLVIATDTVSCNIAANLVGPAYDFSALAPRRISYRTGAWITALIGAGLMPWRLIESSAGYIFTWLIGYSALLGPIAGIMIADYWIIRRGRIDVDALYAEDGAYAYGGGGWNPAALIALAAAVAPNVPGFLATAAPGLFGGVDPVWTALYPYAWFVGVAIAASLYCLLMRVLPRRAVAA